jgi:xanthosine utilization system XapX-like protein
MRFDWLNIAIGVACIVLAGLVVGWVSSMIPLALPGFVWTAIAALIGILVWFTIMPRIKR